VSKYSREPQQKRRRTDGAITSTTLSPDILSAGGAQGGGGALTIELTFRLDSPNLDVLDQLMNGLNVQIDSSTMDVTRRRVYLGRVPAAHRARVRALLPQSPSCYIRDLPHKAIWITVVPSQ